MHRDVNFDDPRRSTPRIQAANRLTGEARRKAWADLDVDLMRERSALGAVRAHSSAARSSRAASAAFSCTLSTASTSQPRARSDDAAALALAREARRGGGAARARPGSRARRTARERARADAPKGGTLRSARTSTSIRSTRRSRYTPSSGLIAVRDVRAAVPLPGRARRGRRRASSRRSFGRSRSPATVAPTPSELRETFRFHTGARVTAQSFADAFNRDADPRLPSPATAFMHEIVGADAVIDGKAAVDLRRPRARPLPAADPAHEAESRTLTARLTLRSSARSSPTPRSTRGNRQPRRLGPLLRRRAGPQPADRAETQPVLPRQAARERRRDRVDDRRDRSRTACALSSRTGSTSASEVSAPRDASARSRREVRRQPARRPGVRQPVARHMVLRLQPPPAGVQRARARSRSKKAINFAIDRPALARTLGFLAVKRTDQMLPPALARAESIYPLGGADVSDGTALVRQGAPQAEQARPLHVECAAAGRHGRSARVQPEAARHRPRGEVLRSSTPSSQKADHPRRAVRHRPRAAGLPTTPTRAGFFGSLLDPLRRPAARHRSIRASCQRMEAANRLTGAARRRAWADIDVDLMRNDPPWAPFVHHQNRTSSRGASAASSSSPSFGVDIAAALQEVDGAQALTLASRCSPWRLALARRMRVSRARPAARNERRAEAPKGGTLRIGLRRQTSTSSIPRSRYLPGRRGRSGSRRARSCSTTRTRRVRRGRGSCRRSSTGSRSRGTGGRTPSS